jgi:hypothetical protein
MSGALRRGSVFAARMAVEDFNPASHGMKVEIVSADHQNKPDIGSEVARRWFDVDHVDAIADVPNSGVALAVSNVTREKNRVFLVSGAADSDLTEKAVDVKQIGRDLGVRYVLEGSQQQGGNRVRVSAQLIRQPQWHHQGNIRR